MTAGSLAAGETASYALAVPPATAAVVTVRQNGIDVRVRLVDPASGTAEDVSSWANGRSGDEILLPPISDAFSAWTVVVEPVLPAAGRGRYEIEVSFAPADERSAARVDARRVFVAAAGRERTEGATLEAAAAGLHEAARAAELAGDRALAGEALYQAGLVADLLGDHGGAMESMAQSLAVFADLGLDGRRAVALNRLGDLSRKVGEVAAAERYLAQALPIAREARDPVAEADILNNTGLLLSSVGRKEEAIAMLTAAIPLAQEVGSLDVESALHHNIGQAYSHLGDFPRSIEAYERSLELKRRMGSRRRTGNTLNNLAGVYFSLGDTARAFSIIRDSLALWEVAGSQAGRGNALAWLGRFQYAVGDSDAALESFAAALPLLQAARDRAGEGSIFANRAEIAIDRGRIEAALADVGEALRLARAAADHRGEARALAIQARALREAGRIGEATAAIAAAVEVVEESRGTMARPDLRSSYLSVVRRYYDAYIDLLLAGEEGAATAAAAFSVSERARSRALLEGLAESAARIRKGIPAELAERERTVQAELNAKESYRARLLRNGAAAAEVEKVSAAVASLLEEWRLLQSTIRRESPGYAALKMPAPATVETVQGRLLAPGTALLEYHIGSEGGRAWVIDAGTVSVHPLPAAAAIDGLARRYHEALSRDRNGLSAAERASLAASVESIGRELSDAILAPLGARLAGKRLLIVPDGALHYVPFAALPHPGSDEPLLARFEIAYLPSASVLDTLRASGGTGMARGVAVFADPVFSRDDPRLSASATATAAPPSVSRADEARFPAGGFPRLRFSRREAEAIVAASKDRTLEALDFEASKQRLMSADLRRYGILHIATHGSLDTEHPELSGLVLSLYDERGQRRDGTLRLHEIYNLELDAELVVLSACRTALGREVHGEGLIGMTRGFMFAGASRVISSIWNVDDRASALLMSRFYSEVLEGGAAPAAALREAQLQMAKQQRWRDPHYWAAFGLHGEWR